MVELGNKHQCPDCGTRFYDLGRSDKICPKCGTNAVTGEAAKTSEPDAAKKTKARGEEE